MVKKSEPKITDCYLKAKPDEPMFILLGRDKAAPAAIELWARERENHIKAGLVADVPEEWEHINSARQIAADMKDYQYHNPNASASYAKKD